MRQPKKSHLQITVSEKTLCCNEFSTQPVDYPLLFFQIYAGGQWLNNFKILSIPSF